MMYSQSYLYFPPRGLSAHADIEGQATASPPLGLSANCIPHFSATVRVARHGRQAQIPRPLKSGPCERCLKASDAFLVIRALDCCSSDVHVSYTCSIAAPADVDRNRCSYPLATELQGGRQDTHAVRSSPTSRPFLPTMAACRSDYTSQRQTVTCLPPTSSTCPAIRCTQTQCTNRAHGDNWRIEEVGYCVRKVRHPSGPSTFWPKEAVSASRSGLCPLLQL